MADLSRCFNPRPPSGGRLSFSIRLISTNCFNPRPPSGGRPRLGPEAATTSEFQSTPPEWRATGDTALKLQIAVVSIHAPRVEGDLQHAPDEVAYWAFQSTPPEWRATPIKRIPVAPGVVSIHAPRVEGDVASAAADWRRRRFNPRPPSGGRPFTAKVVIISSKFQSTPPEWRATLRSLSPLLRHCVSIHAPRVEGDLAALLR